MNPKYDDPNYDKFVRAFASSGRLLIGNKSQTREDVIWFQDSYDNNYYIDSSIVYRIGMKLYRLENRNEEV